MGLKEMLGAFIALMLIGGCSKKEEIQDEQTIVSKTFQKFELKDLKEKSITAEETGEGMNFKGLEGKIVFVDFFATWCPPCKAEIPHLVSLQEKYKEKFAIVAVLLEENKDKNELAKFINDHQINYFVSNSPDNFAMAKLVYGAVKAPQSMPIPLMVMYKDGKYLTHYLGAVPEEMIESDIKKALGE